MAHDPADGVHRTEMPRGVLFGHAIKASQPFASCEPQLVDERMRHYLNFTRPSRSGGLSASPSSTMITNFPAQCGVGYTPSLRSMARSEPSGILIGLAYGKPSHHSSRFHSSSAMR